MFLSGRSIFFMFFGSADGIVFGNAVFVTILKMCDVENDADGIKTYFRPILELFSEISGRCSL